MAVNALCTIDPFAAGHRQHLEVGLEDVKPLGAMLPQGAVAACECAEWAASNHPGFRPRCPGALSAEQRPGPHDPLASNWLALAWFPMAVAVATGIAVARLTALTADFELLAAAGGAVSVCWLSHRNLPFKERRELQGTHALEAVDAYGITRALRVRHAAPFVPRNGTEGEAG